MKLTIKDNRSSTTKTRSKAIEGEGGKKRIAVIEAKQDDRHGNDTKRRIRIVTDTAGEVIKSRNRENENGGSPTELEANNQLYYARTEFQEENQIC